MQGPAAPQAEAKPSGLLTSFVRNIGVNVMGTQSLSQQDIQAALTHLKAKLMERNVAEEIAGKYDLSFDLYACLNIAWQMLPYT